MTCKPKDIFQVAKELADSSNEAKIRASIGRSYYCAFHSCLLDLEITDTKQWTGGNGGVHEKVIGEYKFGGDKAIAYILQNIKSKRHLADYNLNIDINQDDAKSSIELVENLLKRLKT